VELIKQLIDYDKTKPRPIPRGDKLLPYTLCENHRTGLKSFEGECIFGQRCKQAHDKYELATWEEERKGRAREKLTDIVRPYSSHCELKLCKGTKQGAGRGMARGVVLVGQYCGGNRCRCAHSDKELLEWIRKGKLVCLT
jgi:hypothetical protein